jgi:hypothetical protein
MSGAGIDAVAGRVAAADVVTRMLLASDGSTTRLLQAATGQALAVRVDLQRECRVGELAPRVRAALEVADERDEDARVVERRSRLLTAAGLVVSVNHVVLAPSAVQAYGAPDLAVPIGFQLSGGRVPQYRELLDSGRGDWPPDGPARGCAFKAYLIHDVEGRRIYVHESFNPGVIPPPVLGDPAAGPAD